MIKLKFYIYFQEETQNGEVLYIYYQEETWNGQVSRGQLYFRFGLNVGFMLQLGLSFEATVDTRGWNKELWNKIVQCQTFVN